MSESLPVRATILSSTPCTLKDAATLLGNFLKSATVPDVGPLRGCLESAAGALEDLVSKLALKQKGRSVKHSRLDHKSADIEEYEKSSKLTVTPLSSEVERINGVKKKSPSKRNDGVVQLGQNEHVVKKRSHSKKKDGAVELETNEHDVRKVSHSKRKDGTVDLEQNEHDVNKGSHSKGKSGAVKLEQNEHVAKKRKAGAVDLEQNEHVTKKRKAGAVDLEQDEHAAKKTKAGVFDLEQNENAAKKRKAGVVDLEQNEIDVRTGSHSKRKDGAVWRSRPRTE